MKTARTLLGIVVSAPLLATAAPGTVEFRSADPATFTDLRTYPVGGVADTAMLHDSLRAYILRAAQRHLPADTHLTVTLLDVDMAGSFWPAGGFKRERRIVRLGESPRIDLEIRLTAADGTILRQGRRSLTDANYLFKRAPGQYGALAHEKGLILRWLRAEFPERT
jgi:hypothetical protein